MAQKDMDIPGVVVAHPPEHQGFFLTLPQPEMVAGDPEAAASVFENCYVSCRHALICRGFRLNEHP